jgi:hypothetical protein
MPDKNLGRNDTEEKNVDMCTVTIEKMFQFDKETGFQFAD